MKYRIVERADERFDVQTSRYGMAWATAGGVLSEGYSTEDEANTAMLALVEGPRVVAEIDTRRR